MTTPFECHVAFATSAAKDFRNLERHLSSSFALEQYLTLPLHAAMPPIDILLIDFAHQIGPMDQMIRELETVQPPHAVILADTVRQLESFPMTLHLIDRIFHHPTNSQGYQKLALFLSDLTDPDAERKFSKAEFDRKDRTLELTFRNGQFFKFPAIVVEDLNADKIKRVRISRSGYEIVIEQENGVPVNVPWDFVRYHCDPGYAYYQRKGNPTLAGRIARNIKILRAQQKLSSYDLASKTKIARPNIARIESARTNPNLATLERIAGALHVPTVRLLR